MPAVPNAMRLDIDYIGASGVTAQNALHFVNIGGTFNQAAVDGVWADFAVAFAKWISNDYTLLSGSKAYNLATDPPAELIVAGVDETGDNSGNATPANLAYVLSLQGKPGRRGHGRIYIPGLEETVVSGQAYVSGAFRDTVLTDFATAIADAATDHGWLLAVYSRVDGTVSAVNVISAGLRVDTQRRRLSRLPE